MSVFLPIRVTLILPLVDAVINVCSADTEILGSLRGCQKILLPTLSVRIVLDSLLIGESHLLLSHPLLVGVLGTSFGAEACNRSLSQKTISTPLADSFNFNVTTHFVGVNFALICSCASVDVRLRPQTSTTLLTLGVKWVAVVQNPYKMVHKNA